MKIPAFTAALLAIAAATLTAPAQTLLLHLWKRLPPEDPALSWAGDRAAGRRLLAMPLSS